ncbi:MAG: hypothetical protein J6Y85_00805 [Alphaproteobacteria bacterium]|nr:hypothetical protein [Alphaproteobacteria bacterium]
MTYAFLIGLVLGGGYIWYNGLHTSQPWPDIAIIFAVSTLATVVAYFALKFLMGISSFVFKILVIAGILFACYYGGKKAIVLVHKEDAAQQTSFIKQ